MSRSRPINIRLPMVTFGLLLLAGCAHAPPLSPPEMEQLRYEFSKAILSNISVDFPDSHDPEVEILSASETSSTEVNIHYRLRYTQDNEGGGHVLTSRTLDAQLTKLPEGGYRVLDRKTSFQEMEFDQGALIESKTASTRSSD